MQGTDALARATIGLVAAAALGGQPQAEGADEARLREQLTALSRRRVFFGHQSVGMGVLEGLRTLAVGAGAPLRIVQVAEGDRPAEGSLQHAFVAANGRPEQKLEAFARMFRGGPAQGADVAILKLCWADFDGATDAGALFSRYRATLAELRRLSPRTTFVHVTVPLTTVQAGPKALLKRLLGRSPYGVEENARRDEYNALLRAEYAGKEPVFDLAALESTGPDGRTVTYDSGGRRIPVLSEAWTDDGGHLNEAGRRRAALALVALLATLPEPAGR